jgi:hypothetical protein
MFEQAGYNFISNLQTCKVHEMVILGGYFLTNLRIPASQLP